MKKANQPLNALFYVAEEMIPNNGEDCYYHDTRENAFIIASFDGCGGSGSKKYANYSDKTGAYVASRAVCGGVKAWFEQSRNGSELTGYIQNALAVCKKYADRTGRIMGSLNKSFPTTAAILMGEASQKGMLATCFWAGDSRCYMLDANGLHQLSADDLEGQDAMSNLTSDGVMTNVINGSTPFEIHQKTFSIQHPCILLTATDGCFGYLKSPMEFEHMLLDTLLRANNLLEWKVALNDRMYQVAGDDYTLCVAISGFRDFDGIRRNFLKRAQVLTKDFLNPQYKESVLWERYKQSYSIYL